MKLRVSRFYLICIAILLLQVSLLQGNAYAQPAMNGKELTEYDSDEAEKVIRTNDSGYIIAGWT